MEEKIQTGDIGRGAKVFVFLVFFTLALSFFTTTAVFIHEFWDSGQWFSLAVYYSHLFIFFPIFGTIALYAFYLPSTVFVDLYWNHIKAGKIRFVFGAILMGGLSFMLSQMLTAGQLPTIWEIKPAVLASDESVPPNCSIHSKLEQAPPAIPCQRLSINQAVAHVRHESSKRVGLSKFIRSCKFDAYLPAPAKREELRHCFANGQRQTATQCCQAQKLLGQRMKDFKKNPENLSTAGIVHKLLLPLKVFFLIMLLIIGAMLVYWSWRRKLDHYYEEHMHDIEKGILSGVAAMLFWPMTNHAFIQSATVLFGFDYTGDSFFAQSAPAFSILFGVWATFIIIFFMQHSEQKQLEMIFKAIGVLFSVVAFLKYDLIIDYFVRLAGSGVDDWAIIFMIVALVIVLIPLASRKIDRIKRKAQDFLEG